MEEKETKKVRRGNAIKNKLRKFKVWCQNIRGIKSKIDSLRDKIDEVQPTVICLTETRLIEDEDVQVDGHYPFRNDRNSQGGGILILVRNEIKNICTIVKKERENREM